MTDDSTAKGSRRTDLRGIEPEATLALDRRSLRISAVVALVAGTLAIIFPFAASIGVALVTGAALAAVGVVEVVGALRQRGTRRITAPALFGEFALLTGLLSGIDSIFFAAVAFATASASEDRSAKRHSDTRYGHGREAAVSS